MGKVGLLLGVGGEAAHVVWATKRVPISYELSAANVAEVRLTGELLEEASGILVPKEDLARRLLWEIWPTRARLRSGNWPSTG
jgi:hypothetical protein